MIEIKVKVEGLEEVVDLLKKLLEEKEPTAEEQPQLTREDVRKAFLEKATPQNKEKLKALLEKYNAANISHLDEKYFAAIIQDLEAL